MNPRCWGAQRHEDESLAPRGREMIQAVLRRKNVLGDRVSGFYTEGWPTGLQEREDDHSEATMKVA
jgi:hypothetical protein